MRLGTLNAVFGALLAVTGLYFAAAGPAATAAFGVPGLPDPGGGPVDVPAEWRLVGFVRMFGVVLLLAGLLLWAVGRHLSPGRVRTFATKVAVGAGLAFVLAAIQQTALWNTLAGWGLTGLLGGMVVAYGWVAARTGAPGEAEVPRGVA